MMIGSFGSAHACDPETQSSYSIGMTCMSNSNGPPIAFTHRTGSAIGTTPNRSCFVKVACCAFSILDAHPRMNVTLPRREAENIAAYIGSFVNRRFYRFPWTRGQGRRAARAVPAGSRWSTTRAWTAGPSPAKPIGASRTARPSPTEVQSKGVNPSARCVLAKAGSLRECRIEVDPRRLTARWSRA
jgi:hypothetical protein